MAALYEFRVGSRFDVNREQLSHRASDRSATRRGRVNLTGSATFDCSFLETTRSMITLDEAHQPAHMVDDTEVVKGLEQRGVHGVDSLSLEELELLTERKRKQLHQEAVERKAQLESEIASVGQQIEELQARKSELETQLRALAKSMGAAGKSGEGTAKRAPRKPKKPAEADAPSIPQE